MKPNKEQTKKYTQLLVECGATINIEDGKFTIVKEDESFDDEKFNKLLKENNLNNFNTKLDPVEVFNEHRRDFYWKEKEKEDEFKRNFRFALLMYDVALNVLPQNEMRRRIYRHAIGYNGTRASGLWSKIYSKNTIDKNSSECTLNHLFGPTEVGEYVIKEYIKSGHDKEYMVNEWLYENLYLWMTVKVTRQEQSKDSIIQDEHTIEEKRNWKHYQGVSELMFDD